MSDQDVICQWTRLVQREDDEINLAEAALGIARTEYPRLDSGGQLARLDRMAAELRASPAASALANIEALNEYLVDKEKFSGNDEEYDDLRRQLPERRARSPEGNPDYTVAGVHGGRAPGAACHWSAWASQGISW